VTPGYTEGDALIRRKNQMSLPARRQQDHPETDGERDSPGKATGTRDLFIHLAQWSIFGDTRMGNLT